VKQILFFVLLLLIGCGGSSTNNSIILNHIDIPEYTGDKPLNTFPSIPSDAEIKYVGPYTCGEYRVTPDGRLLKYGMTDEQSYNNHVNAIEIATDYWNTALGFDVFTMVYEDDKCVKTDINIRVPLDWFDPTKSGVKRPNSTAGFATYPKPGGSQCSCVISLNPNFANDWHTIAHELGHCLGIDHNEISSDSLMYVSYTSNSYISEELSMFVLSKINNDLFGPETVVGPLLEQCN